MAKGGKEKPGEYQLQGHGIEEAFKQINDSHELSLDQKAGLEFAYLEALAKPWSIQPGYGIPNLERYIELHPKLYVQAVAWAYKRNDEGTDPPEIKAAPENVERSATMAYKLLDGLERMPGHNESRAHARKFSILKVRPNMATRKPPGLRACLAIFSG